MFYVFGINGPMYQGSSAERLSQIAAVRGVARPAGLRANASGIESREAQARQPELYTDTSAPRPRSAVSAYIGTQQGPKPQRQPLEYVADVMTRGALSVSPRMTVEEAWAVLAQHRVGQVPVLADSGRVVGLLLRADVAPPSLAQGPSAPMALRQVHEVMVTPVPAVDEHTSLRRLAHVLMDTGLPGLPVTDAGGQVSGFVSRTDILRAVASDPPLDLWS